MGVLSCSPVMDQLLNVGVDIQGVIVSFSNMEVLSCGSMGQMAASQYMGYDNHGSLLAPQNVGVLSCGF